MISVEAYPHTNKRAPRDRIARWVFSISCGTGRNDIVASKVSRTGDTLFFYVRTEKPLSPHTDPNWMLLFLDIDSRPSTGWLGYDFVVNRVSASAETATLERHQEGYTWGEPVALRYRVAGNELELAIPYAALDLTTQPQAFNFKWADNIQQTGEASDFTLNGDVAPNDRFNYRATWASAPE